DWSVTGVEACGLPIWGRVGAAEQRETRSPSGAGVRTVDQMIRTLNKGRRNDTLYVKLMSSDSGAVVSGEPLSSLPPSVLGVLEGSEERRVGEEGRARG